MSIGVTVTCGVDELMLINGDGTTSVSKSIIDGNWVAISRMYG